MTDVSPTRLIVVDDDEAYLDLLETALERTDTPLDVTATTDPARVLDAVEAGTVDCVVSDYEMPASSGLELLDAVRECDERLPFVLLTGVGSERVASEAIDADVTSYLSKHAEESIAALAERVAETATDAVRAYYRRRALDDHLAFVESVLGALDDVVYVVDTSGTPLYWSDALRDVTGYADDDLSHLTVYNIVPEGEHETLTAALDTVRGGASVTVRLPLAPRDGDPVPFELSAAPLYGDDGDVVGIAGIGRDLTERERYERGLEGLQRTTSRLLDADDPDAVAAAVTEAAEYVAPDAYGVVYRYDPANATLVPAAATHGVEDEDFTYDVAEDAPVPRAYRSGDPERVPTASIDDDRDRGPVDSVAAFPIGDHGVLVFGFDETDDDDAARAWTLAGILAANATAALDRLDRTAALRDREHVLATLHARSAELARATDPDAVAETIVDAAGGAVNAPGFAVYRWEDAAGRLVPSAVTGDVDPRVVDATADGWLVWEAFVEGETTVAADLADDPSRAPWPGARSAVAAPLGEHGVFVAASPTPDAFDDRDVEFVDLIVTYATSSLERAAREARLRETEDELRERNAELQRLNRLNRVIRDITGALVDAESRGGVTHAVCENLAADDRYALAWIGRREGGETHVEAWAGAGESFLDHVVELGTEHPLAATRARDDTEARASAGVEGRGSAAGTESGSVGGTGSQRGDRVTVVDDVLRDPAFAGLRDEAMRRGFRSAIRLPLRHRDRCHGFLELYARVPGAFGSEERDVLAELAAHIADALGAVERTETLLSGRSLELRFSLAATDDPLFALAERAGRAIDVTSIAPHDGGWLLHAAVAGEPTQLVEAASGRVAVTDAEVVRADEDGSMLAVVVSDSPVLSAFADRDATIRHLRATPTGGTITVAVSPATDVRAFADAIRERLPSADLSRRAPAGDTAANALRHDLSEILTDKQFQALRTAYARGYFEWPRETTGEVVADDLGVAGPTFHQHLRKALGRLLDDALGTPPR
ncbi:PAS domain S-box-containing protein [Halarchaeum solikamskense]|uniref:GAF domain-containing protein n=1 Tax=Halarchaeum nitratireducens TaxID=489913 RepID=UPI001B3AC4F3|nr:GAF domain-containing protein [Halarchaeum solikamskense]MBP2249814.1 PAS domain S-box-containing protein [Halarchaeum solikamskense]